MNTARRGNHGNLAPNQFTCQWRQLIKLILGPAVFDCDILALTKAAVLKPLTKCAEQMRVRGGRCTVKDSDHRHGRLLRTRRKRPPNRRTAEQCDESAPSHVEHGLPSGTLPKPAAQAYRTPSLPRKRPAGPWGWPESF